MISTLRLKDGTQRGSISLLKTHPDPGLLPPAAGLDPPQPDSPGAYNTEGHFRTNVRELWRCHCLDQRGKGVGTGA